MPNWCENMLTVSGEPDEVARFVSLARTRHECPKGAEQDFSILENFLPRPDDIGDGWYDWSHNVWGCKWPDSDTTIPNSYSEDDEEVSFSFTTPWCPPINGFVSIAKMFPELKFILGYKEFGMQFYGITEFYDDGDYNDVCLNFEDIDGYDKVVTLDACIEDLVADALDSLYAQVMGVRGY